MSLLILILFTSFLTSSYAAPIFLRDGGISYDNIGNSTSSEVIIVYPLSSCYAGLQRALYWVIIVFTIVGLGNTWLVTAAFGTAMTYSSVAAVHAIAIYAVRSTQYYESDAIAIWEILFCTSVMLPSWLAHYRRLRSTTAQIVLRLWGALMFIGGVFAILELKNVNSKVIAHQNDCVDKLPSGTASFSVIDWLSQPECYPWQPYKNATQPMREIDEVVIMRTSHQLAKWTGTIGTLAQVGGILVCVFILAGLMFPDGKALDKHRQEQLKKYRKYKRAKGNHPADTPQMPIAWCFGIVTLTISEILLNLVPVSEKPFAVGQWGTWVSLIFVLVAVLINHYLEAPIEDMYEALGRAVGPLVWFSLDWRGHAPSRAEARKEAEAAEKAQKEALEAERKSRMRTRETQTDEVEVEDDSSSSSITTKTRDRVRSTRRFSESDIGNRPVQIDYFDFD